MKKGEIGMCLEEYVQRAVREQERAVHTNEKRGQNTTKSKMIWVLDEAFLEREFGPSNILINAHIPSFNRNPRPHKHDFFELVYLHRGCMTNTVDGNILRLNQGDFCLMNPHAVHMPVTDGDQPLALNIMLKKQLFDRVFLGMNLDNELFANFFVDFLFFKKQKQNYLLFSSRFQNTQIVSQYLLQILREYYDTALYHQRVIESMLSCLFVELARSYQRELDQASAEENSRGGVTEIIAYLAENFRTASLQSTAQRFHYHPKYIPTLLKKHFGKSFTEIIQCFKLNHACQLLRQTDLSVSEIIEESGYSNRSYFYRVFQQQLGVHPLDFRILPPENLPKLPWYGKQLLSEASQEQAATKPVVR